MHLGVRTQDAIKCHQEYGKILYRIPVVLLFPLSMGRGNIPRYSYIPLVAWDVISSITNRAIDPENIRWDHQNSSGRKHSNSKKIQDTSTYFLMICSRWWFQILFDKQIHLILGYFGKMNAF